MGASNRPVGPICQHGFGDPGSELIQPRNMRNRDLGRRKPRVPGNRPAGVFERAPCGWPSPLGSGMLCAVKPLYSLNFSGGKQNQERSCVLVHPPAPSSPAAHRFGQPCAPCAPARPEHGSRRFRVARHATPKGQAPRGLQQSRVLTAPARLGNRRADTAVPHQVSVAGGARRQRLLSIEGSSGNRSAIAAFNPGFPAPPACPAAPVIAAIPGSRLRPGSRRGCFPVRPAARCRPTPP